MKNINVNEDTFTKLPKNRKTAPYETALAIARLIILNYAPNVRSGSERMLALLFDMNSLWEEYILERLKQAANKEGFTIYGQNSKSFWNNISIRPDIVIKKENDNNHQTYIIDTKWKNIDYSKPSTHDLRQMYVYNEYWDANNAMLLYPSNIADKGIFINYEDIERYENGIEHKIKKHTCAIGKITIFENDSVTLNPKIGETILQWVTAK